MTLHDLAARGDAAAVDKLLRSGAHVDPRDQNGRTPLMIAATSPHAEAQLLRLLLQHGADPNAVVASDKSESVLALAVAEADFEKIQMLVEAGANVGFIDPAGYSILLRALYRQLRENENCDVLDYLISQGAPLDIESRYGESVLRVSSCHGKFSLVKFFLERGADPTPLGWNPIFHAVAFSEFDEIQAHINAGVPLENRDSWERTPFLLSVHAGRQNVAQLLLDSGSDLNAKGRCGMTAPIFAIARDDADMLRWLLASGIDIDARDDFGHSPMQMAAEGGAVACVRVLLGAGASPTALDAYGNRLISSANHPEVIALLSAAGASLSDVQSSARSRLTGGGADDDLVINEADYRRHRTRSFGKRNPERMNNPFWEEMIRTRASAYSAGALFGEPSLHAEPIWCFSRFGQSLTQLPDGRYVEIGGEHEDSYDPDFCIYNDVVVHRGDGTCEIYGYPAEAFPPTDFHSATLCDGAIYIVGCLGYVDQRCPAETPVYRLCCDTWRIEKMKTRGDAPGWIFKHEAMLIAPRRILIRGGCVVTDADQEPIENTEAYELDLDEMVWNKAR